MRFFALAALSAYAQAKSWDDYTNLTLEEQEALYKKITGPYCDENALSDPLCVHKAEELMMEELQA